eukprot:UN04635
MDNYLFRNSNLDRDFECRCDKCESEITSEQKKGKKELTEEEKDMLRYEVLDIDIMDELYSMPYSECLTTLKELEDQNKKDR